MSMMWEDEPLEKSLRPITSWKAYRHQGFWKCMDALRDKIELEKLLENRSGKMENLVNQQFLSSAYRGRRVFLTGHTGFKGAWLMAWLHELGAMLKDIRWNLNTRAACMTISRRWAWPNRLLQIYVTVINSGRVTTFQPDYIFHLAAQPLVRRSYQKPSETFDVNVVGTANLLESARVG